MVSIPSKSGPESGSLDAPKHTKPRQNGPKKGCFPLKVKKTHELDKSGFLRHFSSDFEQFRAILSNFKALLDVSSFALNTHI